MVWTVAVAVGALVAGCTPTPTPSPTATVPAPGTAVPSPESSAPTGPALLPEGSAEENLPYFRQVVDAVWASDPRVDGRALVDALVAAGFDKGAMQVTPDTSTVGNPAESLQVSVRWGEQCLIGQVGQATGQPVSAVADALPDGACLIGDTRPIDW